MGEYLPCYWNKIHQLVQENVHVIGPKKAYFNDGRVTNISKSFTYKMKTSWHSYGTKLRYCQPVYTCKFLLSRCLYVCPTEAGRTKLTTLATVDVQITTVDSLAHWAYTCVHSTLRVNEVVCLSIVNSKMAGGGCEKLCNRIKLVKFFFFSGLHPWC